MSVRNVSLALAAGFALAAGSVSLPRPQQQRLRCTRPAESPGQENGLQGLTPPSLNWSCTHGQSTTEREAGPARS